MWRRPSVWSSDQLPTLVPQQMGIVQAGDPAGSVLDSPVTAGKGKKRAHPSLIWPARTASIQV